jgi:lipopolysaccharide-induced tumor necrosis factor-alpha factor
MNQPLPTGYYQQGQPLPTGTPMTMAAGSYSMACNCPYCHQSIATRAEKDSGVAVWLSATVICVLGCFCGCCLIPFCLDDLKVWNIFED